MADRLAEQKLPEIPESAVRDRLALDRTHLANERTLLAYVRTALAMAGGGAALLHFTGDDVSAVAGWGLITSGAVMLGVGVFRFAAMTRRLGQGE